VKVPQLRTENWKESQRRRTKPALSEVEGSVRSYTSLPGFARRTAEGGCPHTSYGGQQVPFGFKLASRPSPHGLWRRRDSGALSDELRPRT
jgi:hypothetical protein